MNTATVSEDLKMLTGCSVAVVLIRRNEESGLHFVKAYGKPTKELKLTEADLPQTNPASYFGADQTRNALLAAFNGESAGFEFRKKARYYHCVLEPVPSTTGEDISEIIGTITDVTEKRKSERNFSLLSSMVSSLNEAISIADSEDRFIYVNPAFSKMYGYEIEQLLNQKSDILWSNLNSSEVTAQILPDTLNGGWKGYLYNKNKNGKDFLIYLRTSSVQSPNGELVGVVGVANPVEEHLRSEADKFARGLTDNLPTFSTAAPIHILKEAKSDLQQSVQISIEPLKSAYSDCFLIEIENQRPQSNFLWFSEQLDKNLLCLIESHPQDMMSMFRALMVKGLMHQIVNHNLLSLPDQVLNKLHHILTPYLDLNYNLDGDEPEMNISFFNISKNKQTFRYSGVNSEVVLSSGGKIRHFQDEGKPFRAEDGMVSDRYFKVHAVNISEGDVIYLYSQSLFQQPNAETETCLDIQKWTTLLEQIHQKPFTEQKQFLSDYLHEWIGESADIQRNIFIMGIRI